MSGDERDEIAKILARRTAPRPAEVAGTPWSLEGDADELGEIVDEVLAVVRRVPQVRVGRDDLNLETAWEETR